jgi:hypothetical protein
VAQAKFAVDVLDYDDRAIDDDAEIMALIEEAGGFAGQIEKDEREEQGQRNRQRWDDGGAKLTRKNQDNQTRTMPRTRLPSTVSVVMRT